MRNEKEIKDRLDKIEFDYEFSLKEGDMTRHKKVLFETERKTLLYVLENPEYDYKNELKEIKNLIEMSMDSEQTPDFDDSMDCLYKAIDKLDKLIYGEN